MAITQDREEIRALLRRDPVWSLYALGDMGPAQWPHTTWHRTSDELALVYKAYSIPILWGAGTLKDVAAAVLQEPRYSVQLRPEAIPALASSYSTGGLKRMWRMSMNRRRFQPNQAIPTERLSDPVEIAALYRDGEASGESPDFFFAAMVAQGVFYGCREAGALVAVAGTHLVEAAEDVAAVGNIYTRRDCRNRGLAAAATSAVVTELLAAGIGTAGLNVYQTNAAAIHVYERLGFVQHCEFVEGIIEHWR